jgi:hypothetical protein
VSKVKIRAWLDQDDAFTVDMVRQYGLFIQHVSGPPVPSFAYTVGLFGLHHPELLVFGLCPDHAAHVLNSLGERIREGEDLVPGIVITVDGWPRRIRPEPVPNPGDIVFSANRYYARPGEFSVPVLQLSYDDENGRFPDEPGFSDPESQPRPGTFQA